MINSQKFGVIDFPAYDLTRAWHIFGLLISFTLQLFAYFAFYFFKTIWQLSITDICFWKGYLLSDLIEGYPKCWDISKQSCTDRHSLCHIGLKWFGFFLFPFLYPGPLKRIIYWIIIYLEVSLRICLDFNILLDWNVLWCKGNVLLYNICYDIFYML